MDQRTAWKGWKTFKILDTSEKEQLVTTIESDSIHKLETDNTAFLNELDSKFKEFCENKSRQSKDVKTP